ncbi:MAG: pectinesterase family protein [Rhodocyclaceae bacterium]
MNRQRRICLALASSLPLASMLEGCAMLSMFSSADAYVDASGKTEGAFPTIQAALNAAPEKSPKPWVISVKPGRYYEKITITKPNIHLVGADQHTTVLTFDAYSGLKKPDGNTWGTFACGTLIVQAVGFKAANLTIENGYDYPANDTRDPKDPLFTNAPQAVAVMTDTGSDQAFFHKVRITGYQDTLFTNVGRSYFKDCYVSGHVDFIFGAGQTLFENCEIASRPRTKPGVNPVGYVTAPSTQISNKYGLVFLRCKLVKENDKLPAASTPLGRPWHPTKAFPDGRYADPDAIGSSVFIECFMDDHITGDGWAAMAGTQKSGPDRVWFQPEDSRFFEYKSSGPGAHTSGKRRQLTAAEAADYTAEKVLGNWKP